ncbi:MAG: sialate O-acetylesterase [Chitinispirillia bacterium]|jgi:hypothetical protein
MNSKFFVVLCVFWLNMNVFSQDSNFHIYLCFGQSNMEGQGAIQPRDKTVDSRFQVLQSLDCTNLGRKKATWHTAVPPLCQCWSGLTPADYFGRTMIEELPDSIKVGVINVAVGGCDIRLFDKDIYLDYDSTYTESWFTDKLKSYGGNPYKHLIDLAEIAKKSGVIKGILLHQGETNTGDHKWPTYVKKIYNDMLTDLSLSAKSVPLLAGELVHADQGGTCASMNPIIAKLPQIVPTAHVISSSGAPAKNDNVHFNSQGQRILGIRYAEKMLSLMGTGIKRFSISVFTTGRGEVTQKPDKYLAHPGDKITFTAKADANNSFIKWTGAASASGTSNPIIITVNKNIRLTAVFTDNGPATGAELVANGDFSDGKKGWTFNLQGGVKGTSGVENGEYVISVTTPGTKGWHAQLQTVGLDISQGTSYAVSFKAKAESPYDLMSFVGMNKAPWATYSGYKTFPIGPEIKTVKFEFSMVDSSDRNARIVFDAGTFSGKIMIDDVSVKPIKKASVIRESSINPMDQFIRYNKDHGAFLFTTKTHVQGSFEIYDMSGKFLARTPHSIFMPGTHSINFIDIDIPPGIYQIRLIHSGSCHLSNIISVLQ